MSVLKSVLDFLIKLINRLRFCDGGRGALHFFIRNWRGIDDVELLGRALATETWRTIIRPKPLSLDGIRSLMVLAPHQDDEVIGAGGLMLAARKRGLDVSIVFATDGRQTGIRLGGKKLAPDEVGVLRHEEAREVCRRLGAQMVELGIDNCSMTISIGHVQRLADVIDTIRPDAIAAPWLFDGAPKHRAINQLLYHALNLGEYVPMQILGYQVNNTPIANAYLDISEFIDDKIALIELYESQNATLRDYAHLARGMAAWNSRFMPSKQQRKTLPYAELFTTLTTKDFIEMVQEFLLRDINAAYCGRTSLAQKMQALYTEMEKHDGHA